MAVRSLCFRGVSGQTLMRSFLAFLTGQPRVRAGEQVSSGLGDFAGRCAGDLGRVRRLGPAKFEAAVRRELPRWGARRPCLRVVRAVFAALADPAGVTAHRPGALERSHLDLGDWRDTRARLADVEARMVAILDDLQLTGLVTTIAGLTPVGAAAILAETGDPARFTSSRALVKHAGLCPRDNASGGYQGKTPISGRGRPVRPPDHPRAQPARPPAGPHRLRRRPAALDPRDHHPPHRLGSGHRRPNPAASGRMNTAPA
jgi:Transposase IS116/IS110/IS902 family